MPFSRLSRLASFVAIAALMPGLSYAAPSHPAPSLAPASADIVQSRTLANGLHVIVVPNHSAPVVQTAMWYDFGSADETQGKRGLAHALEHMMFRGTTELSGPGLIDMSARLGAVMNAQTAEDYTQFYFVVPVDRLDVALRVEADRMQHLKLDEHDWELERGAVLTEIDTDLSNPIVRFIDAMRRDVRGGGAYELTALGERSDVAHATAADLRAYYDRWYAPNNATVVIAGDVEPEAAFAAAQRAFGGIPTKTLPDRVRPAQRRPPNAVITQHGDVPYEIADFAYTIPGLGDQDAEAIGIVVDALNSGALPPLGRLVGSGLAVSGSFYADQQIHGGLLHGIFLVDSHHTLTEVREAYNNAMHEVLLVGVPRQTIEAIKTYRATQDVYRRDSIVGLGNLVGYLSVAGGESLADHSARLAATNYDDVNNAVATYLQQPLAVGDLLPIQRSARDVQAPRTYSSVASDKFAGRVPGGDFVQPEYVRAALATPSTVTSRISPTTFTLANGMHAIVQEVHGTSGVEIYGHIATSPAFDPPGKEGVGDIASILMNTANRSYQFADAGLWQSEALGFGNEFGASGLSSHLDIMVDLLAQGLMNPRYSDFSLYQVRREFRTELERADTDPDQRAKAAFESLLYPAGDPARRELSLSSLARITPSDLASYAKQYFRPDRVTIAIVGDVSATDVRASLDRAFGSWKAPATSSSLALPAVPLPAAATKSIPSTATVTTVRIGQPAIARTNPDYFAMNLMNEIYGGESFDARLMSEVRTKRGLVYGVNSTLDADSRRGTLEIKLSAAPQSVRSAVSLVKSEMVRLQQQPVSADEIDRTKERIAMRSLVSQESLSAVARSLVDTSESGLPLDSVAHLGTYYATITPQQIQAIAKKYLHPDRLVEVYEGPNP